MWCRGKFSTQFHTEDSLFGGRLFFACLLVNKKKHVFHFLIESAFNLSKGIFSEWMENAGFIF